MIFLVPGLAIAAIAAATFPLILHFLLRRPRPTAWPSTMLLQRALERFRRRRRLDGWILLALRTLGIALAGIAMAGPFIGTMAADTGRRELWIVIDDGATAAEILPDGRTVIEVMQEGVLREISRLRAGDQVAVVKASKSARIEIPPTLDHERVRARIRDWKAEPVPSDLQSALELAMPPDPDLPSREILLASSLRRGSVPDGRRLPASWRDRARNVRWRCVAPVEDPAPNHWIDGVALVRTSDSAGQVVARVEMRRVGDTGSRNDIQVRSSAGNVVAQSEVTWITGTSQLRRDVPISGTGAEAWTIQVPPDTQPLDDSVPIVNVARAAPRVTLVGRQREKEALDKLPASGWILRALEAAGVEVRELDPGMLGIRPPNETDVVIITRPDLLDAAGWKWTSKHLQDGGLLVTMPVADSDGSWILDLNRESGLRLQMKPRAEREVRTFSPNQPRGELLAALGAEIDALTEPVTVQRSWNIALDDAESVLTFDSGEPAVVAASASRGRGLVVMLAFPTDLECTDMPLRPLMVPFFQEISRAGRALALGSSVVMTGQIAQFGPSAAGGLLRSMDPQRQGTIEIDPEGRTIEAVPFPGLWALEQRDGRSRWIAARLDPAAAGIEAVDASEIEAWWSPVGTWSRLDSDQPATEGVVRQDSALTLPLLVIALLALVAESLWSRRSSPRPMTGTAP